MTGLQPWEAELEGYQRLIEECRYKGLDAESIERSRTQLSHSIDEIQYLKNEAFLPTGLALGCPLQDSNLTRQLTELAKQAADYVSNLSKSSGPSFAFVPPNSYHITVLNRTHFDYSREVFPLTEQELQLAEDSVQKLGITRITVDVRGMLLTASGRILVSGYPSSGDLSKLRQELGSAVQVCESGKSVYPLHANIPKGATIKFGHLLVPLPEPELRLFMAWLEVSGKRISSRLVFTDLYTQIRRIGL